jgi:NAD(P)-dependent dehydrogenase (short-subunit alcohol dehydrogenase family)
MARFDDKVVLVSGWGRGQGAAEARLLVAQGAKVVIGDVLDNQGQALAVELGPAASFVRHDVTSTPARSEIRSTQERGIVSARGLMPGLRRVLVKGIQAALHAARTLL